MKNNLNKAFSLAEVIVSMALVVMLSVVGFLACTVSVRMTDNRNQHISAWSVAYSAVDCLRVAVNSNADADSAIVEFEQQLCSLVGSNFVDSVENGTGITRTVGADGNVYVFRTDRYTMNIFVNRAEGLSYSVDAYTHSGYKLVDIRGTV